MKSLQRRRKASRPQPTETSSVDEFTRAKITLAGAGRHDLEWQKGKVVAVVANSRMVIRHTQTVTANPRLAPHVAIVWRVPHEQVEADEARTPRECCNEKSRECH